ncbi:MAG: helix-turn-helix domain-containing protein [Clostridia bacterium]|nr:helix-turn-helix domain-containing protein [Clostridia bacterium]
MNQIYTVDDVAKLLDVSVKTIRRYIYAGKISANKIGGQWRITQEQVENYLNQSASKTCCSTNTIHEDDFCIFMDTDYFTSDDKLQLCTIVDYYVEDTESIVKMSQVLSRVVTEDGLNGGKAQYNYVYDEPLKRARFVLWGNPTFMTKASMLLQAFEGDEVNA